MPKSGLYTFTNTKTGDFYFGSSVHLVRRKNEHLSTLKHKKSHHRKFQLDYDIYGREAFVFEIVLLAPVEMLHILEEAVLQELRPKYNTSLSKNGFEGISHSEETRKKISLIKTGVPNNVMKPVIQMDLNGGFIAEYPSLKEAGEKTGISSQSICSVCVGRRKKTGDFKWKHKNQTLKF